jgi:hypothetical protein
VTRTLSAGWAREGAMNKQRKRLNMEAIPVVYFEHDYSTDA